MLKIPSGSMITSLRYCTWDHNNENSEAQSSDSFKYTSVSSSSESRTYNDFSYTTDSNLKYLRLLSRNPRQIIPTYSRWSVLEFSTAGGWRNGIAHYTGMLNKESRLGCNSNWRESTRKSRSSATPSNDALCQSIFTKTHDSLDISLLGILKG